MQSRIVYCVTSVAKWLLICQHQPAAGVHQVDAQTQHTLIGVATFCVFFSQCCAARSGELTNEVYGQDITFVANDWHAALLPTLLTGRFRCVCLSAVHALPAADGCHLLLT